MSTMHSALCTALQCLAVSVTVIETRKLSIHSGHRLPPIGWYGTALHCTALHCTALHCTALHCAALHCTALHCTALHETQQLIFCETFHTTRFYFNSHSYFGQEFLSLEIQEIQEIQEYRKYRKYRKYRNTGNTGNTGNTEIPLIGNTISRDFMAVR